MSKPQLESVAPRRRERRDGRGDKRRRRIYRSLHDCILEKGYIKTTLLDIAQGADMTASHLLYYFKGKEDLLGQYFENVSVQFMQQLDDFRKLDIEGQIRALTDFWFERDSGTYKEIGFMLECLGAAVNEEALRGTKAEFDAHCKAFLKQIFESAPGNVLGTAKDSAELTHAMMMGLRSAVYFDDDIDLEQAHGLFLNTLFRLCNIEATA